MLNKLKKTCLLLLLSFSIFCPASRPDIEKLKISHEKELVNQSSSIPVIKIKTLVHTPEVKEEIEEEIYYDDLEILAQLVHAEAGNQDLLGKRYVVDVVLNRVDSEIFPDTIYGVIFQKNQFSVIKDGGFERAAWNVTEEDYEAVRMELKNRTNRDILYFSRGKSQYAKNHFKHQDHWFGY